MTNRHIMSKLRKIEREVAELSISADPQEVLAAVADRATQRTRAKFVTGCEDALDVRVQKDNDLLKNYLRKIPGFENVDRERARLLSFGSRDVRGT